MRRPWRERERGLDLEPGATVDRLMAELGYAADEARFFSVAINGERVRGDAALADGDRVTVTLVVGGG